MRRNRGKPDQYRSVPRLFRMRRADPASGRAACARAGMHRPAASSKANPRIAVDVTALLAPFGRIV
jgi:hypothetical protein